jgi:glycosyltransferase involved in cell wall biosynthesis
MTTIEALACGAPSIVYDTTACPELVNTQTGRVVPLGNVRALAAAVTDLCNNPQRRSMREACRQRVISLFDRQDRYKDYIALYGTLLNK